MAAPSEAGAIREVHLAAFDEAENEMVAELAVALLAEEDPPSLNLVAEIGGELAGHVCFSPITRQGGQEHLGHLLAPLGVGPQYQKQGIGSALVKEGLERLRPRGGVVIVYGDPAYYGRFGFTRELAELLLPPHPLSLPIGWQALLFREEDRPTSRVPIECVPALRAPALW